MKETVKITRTSITSDVKANMTRKEMADKYGVSVQTIAKVLADAGMKGVRVKTPAYIFIDDTIETESPVVATGETPKATDDSFVPNYAGMTQNYGSSAQM